MIDSLATLHDYREIISENLSNCLESSNLDGFPKYQGKVRDRYDLGDRYALITTDRQSAFDRVLAAIPFKGQVLNQTGAWWFEQTQDIIQNHVISIPDPNVTLAQKCKPFPVEFVVRGYMTGSSSTSIWTQYHGGVRNYCGVSLPEGMSKNQKFPRPILTPTTKEEAHDRPISPQEIVDEGWMTKEHWEYASEHALRLFTRGQELSRRNGLILVDTKYEMGLSEDGQILLIDEIHTPDSSRYWLQPSYEKRLEEDREPENVDKEFLRLWFRENCDPYKDEKLPKAPDELVIELAARYIHLYETITGQTFQCPQLGKGIMERIRDSLDLSVN
jgi:phosphoribosylaminoimidazole-succinocarboxamide synthase